jgi:hypothetical protein
MKPPALGRLFLLRHIFGGDARGFFTGLFNTVVENTVENGRSVDVNGSLSNASAFCTGVVANTLVPRVRNEIRFQVQRWQKAG